MIREATAVVTAEFEVDPDLLDLSIVDDLSEEELTELESVAGDIGPYDLTDKDDTEEVVEIAEGDFYSHLRSAAQAALHRRRHSDDDSEEAEVKIKDRTVGYNAVNVSDGDDLRKLLNLGNPYITNVLTGEPILASSREDMKTALRALAGTDIVTKSLAASNRFAKIWEDYHAGLLPVIEVVKDFERLIKVRFSSPHARCNMAPAYLFFAVEQAKEEITELKEGPVDSPRDLLRAYEEVEEIKERNLLIAKQVCATCVVRDECLEYGMANKRTLGVLGGLTHTQRNAFRAWLRKQERSPEAIAVYVKNKRESIDKDSEKVSKR